MILISNKLFKCFYLFILFIVVQQTSGFIARKMLAYSRNNYNYHQSTCKECAVDPIVQH